jgi:hypothetical protein
MVCLKKNHINSGKFSRILLAVTYLRVIAVLNLIIATFIRNLFSSTYIAM